MACLLLFLLAGAADAATVPSPEEFLGFPVGADRRLADYGQIVAYLDLLDAATDRLTLLRLGETTLGEEFTVAAISSGPNLRDAARYRKIARRLADPRGLDAAEEARLVAEGKVIVLITLNIHSTEIGASQMVLELAHQLALAPSEKEARWMEDVILLVVPSLNPDGQRMVTAWYREHVGTAYEGGPMPRLYHHYAGHDNNRDWFMLNLPETKLLNRLLYHDWHPQLFVDEHQMGMTGARLFLPPFKDPIGENVHPLIWRLVDRVGTAMALREQEAGNSGVIQAAQFDGYWLGGTRNTGWYKNVVGLLTEAASVRIASPVHVDPGELHGGIKGLADYGAQANFPDPWPGGWWRLRDIIDYELVLTRSLLETASRYREDLLRAQVRMARDAVAAGRSAPPAGWAIPAGGRDPVAAAAMIDLLLEHGVEVRRSDAAFRDGSRLHPAGTWIVPADQPYRQFALEVLEPQEYPEIRSEPDGPILLPYDVNTWSFPSLFGVETVRLTKVPGGDLPRLAEAPWPPGVLQGDGSLALLSPVGNAASAAVNDLLAGGAQVRLAAAPLQAAERAWPAGTVLASAPEGLLREVAAARHVTFVRTDLQSPEDVLSLRQPRLGLYRGFLPSMDEGWTRLVLERWGFPYVSIDNARMAAGDLGADFDVILLPDQSKAAIVEGRSARPGYRLEYPPEQQGGIGADGVKALAAFVSSGGTLITLDGSSELPIGEMNLPVARPLAGVGRDRFYCPGSMLRVAIDTSHPLGFGMPAEAAVMFARSQPFETRIPGGEATRVVVARFPEGPLLVSGWIRGEELLRRRAALVEVRKGKGRVILFGFRPQFRAQARATFKLLFNAIHLGGVVPPGS
jgi:hypothetical protein